MDTKRARRMSVALTLALFAANLIAFNALISRWDVARLDLTRDQAFSISSSTRKLVSSLDDDLTIYGYFSKRTHPKLAPLVPQIEDLLGEYRAMGRGRVHVEILDPGTSDKIEQEASDRFGVTSTPFRLASKYESGIVNAYFAIVVKYGDQYQRYGFEDLIDVEPLPDGDVDVRLRNLEYDLTRAIKKVVFGFRGTAELFERVGQPVKFTAVMTPDRMPAVFKDAPEAVRKAADELKSKGKDHFTYEEIVPADPQQEQDVVRRFGAQPMALGLFSRETFYLSGYLTVGNQTEAVPLTTGQVSSASIRELIENSLKRRAPGFLKTVGVVTPQPSIPPEVMMQLRMQGQMPQQPPPEFDQIKTMLRQEYNVRDVSLDGADGVPGQVDVLLVLKPKNWSEREVYNLDQYLMRGGRVLVCAGSYETDFSQQGLNVRPVESGLGPWLKHYGIEISKTLLLDDRNQPLPVPEIRQTPFGNLQTWVMRPYPYLVEIRDNGLKNRAVTGKLEAVRVYWGSPIEVTPPADKKLTLIPILASSDRSWTDDDVAKAKVASYTVPAATKSHLVAAALQGSFESFYKGKDAPVVPGDSSRKEVPLERSPDTRLAVVGDAEFVSDMVARVLGRQLGGAFADNLGFVQNMIDWMNLDNDLIAIRTRTTQSHRIERLGKGTEVALEGINYILPLAALIALGLVRYSRRRRMAPIVRSSAHGARAAAEAGAGS
jgi:ABC-2 type transport system permease protein